MCMICEMDYEEIEAITESDEAKMAWQGMIASSSLSERLQGKKDNTSGPPILLIFGIIANS